MSYHLISVCINGTWFKVPHVYRDDEFFAVVSAGNGYMPLWMKAFHFDNVDQLLLNKVIEERPTMDIPILGLFTEPPKQAMNLKDKRRKETLPVQRKYGDFVLAEVELGWRFYRVDGESCSLVTELKACPITLKEASAYVDRHHRHNAGPKFHKFSICLRVDGEPEPVGVVIASTPKARHQMDGRTLEINRCCVDTRYADACSRLYGLVIRAGRDMGYTRFLTYTLPDEPGGSLRAVGFRLDGLTSAAKSWACPSRARHPKKYPEGAKLRWVWEKEGNPNGI